MSKINVNNKFLNITKFSKIFERYNTLEQFTRLTDLLSMTFVSEKEGRIGLTIDKRTS